jgi:ubiquinone/menaquinone biosynthesis C-methylase UbiE
MQDRAGGLFGWLLIGIFAVIVAACAFLAERSGLMYGFVASILVSGALLYVIHARCAVDWRTVLAVAVVLRVAVFWLQPGLSDDAFRYVWDGQIQHEGVNPYSHRPSDTELSHLTETDLYDLVNSRDYFSVYPPLSQLVFRVGSVDTLTHWRVGYYGIKLIILLIEIAGLVALVWLVPPGRAILYAWNPVVIIEVAGQGHTEGMVSGLLLLAFLMVRRSRHGGAAAAVSAAGMVKLVPFFLLPLFWRRGRWIALGASVVTALLLAVPYAAPHVIPNVLESLNLYVRYFEFNAGPYFAVKSLLQAITGHDLSKAIGPVFRWLFFLSLPVIYYLDRLRNDSLERPMVAILSCFLVLSTTIHPWYVVPLLAVLVLENRMRWHWYWFGLISMGTYLLYVGGPYWSVVILAWAVWAVLATAYHFDTVLQWVQRRRGARKFRAIEDWIGRSHSRAILDLGAGEGYVGLEASKRGAGPVILADVVPMNRTALPWSLVEEENLHFATDSVDYVILYFVLHHAANPVRVLAEAARVARHGVIVVESVYEWPVQLKVLTLLDQLANRLRSGGLMADQEENLHFRTVAEWRQLVAQLRLTIDQERIQGNWIHTKAMFKICK